MLLYHCVKKLIGLPTIIHNFQNLTNLYSYLILKNTSYLLIPKFGLFYKRIPH